MLVKFANDYLEKLYIGQSLKGKPKFNELVVSKFKKCILILKNVDSSYELLKFRSLIFEAFIGQKKGNYSIRVDDKYRLEFILENDIIELAEIAMITELSNQYK